MNIRPCALYKHCLANIENDGEACSNCNKSKKWENGKLPCLIDNQEYLFEEIFADRNKLRMSEDDFSSYIIGLLTGLEFAGYNNNFIYKDLFFEIIDKFGSYMNQGFVNEIKSCRSHE